MGTARKIIFGIYGLLFLGLIAGGLLFSCQPAREVQVQREKILALSEAEKAFILDELIRLLATTERKGVDGTTELQAAQIPPPLSLLKPYRLQLREGSAWLDLAHNFDHGISLRATKEPNGWWQLSAELEEFQPETVLFKKAPSQPEVSPMMSTPP
ncbi:MAG TPA: hypothetical protein PK322_04430 [Opitutaceae bacterium]|nr:hypothetical protein [Opitutaceae bacterium]